MEAHLAVQGSSEWLQIRAGKVTASRIADMMAKTKSGFGASRANYAAQLVAERLTGVPAETFSSPAMKWGTETEPQARAAYSFYSGEEVTEVGFTPHPTITLSGASVDGLVGDKGLVEIKCPQTATHIETLLGQSIPGKYTYQMQWQMACTGREWCDWVSYDPRMPEAMRLFTKRQSRDDAMLRDLEREISAFLAEVADTVSKLQGLYSP